MDISCEGEIEIEDATRADLLAAFENDEARGDFIVLGDLASDDGGFIQAAGEGDGTYAVEYRESGVLHHADGEFKKKQVLNFFLKYFEGDPDWKAGLTFSPIDLEALGEAEGGNSSPPPAYVSLIMENWISIRGESESIEEELVSCPFAEGMTREEDRLVVSFKGDFWEEPLNGLVMWLSDRGVLFGVDYKQGGDPPRYMATLIQRGVLKKPFGIIFWRGNGWHSETVDASNADRFA